MQKYKLVQKKINNVGSFLTPSFIISASRCVTMKNHGYLMLTLMKTISSMKMIDFKKFTQEKGLHL